MAKKKEEVNLSEIDASFVISSFKNKERRNNPSAIPRPLLPPAREKDPEEPEAEPEEVETPAVAGEKQEVQIPATPSQNNRKKKGQVNYKETFVRRNEIKTRECVYISREIHSKIVKLVRALEDTNITIGGYIDVVLSEHLEQNKEDINEIFRLSRRDLL